MIEKTFGLTTTKSTTNMYLFDENQKLKKYNTVYDIIDKYFPVRYKTYELRKKYMIDSLEREVKLISNKAKFIQEQIVEPPTLILRKKKKQEVINMLKQKGYDIIDNDEEYKYLRTMTIDSVEEENFEKLLKLKEEKENELEIIKKTTIEEMWIKELDNLTEIYKNYQNERLERATGIKSKKKRKLKRNNS